MLRYGWIALLCCLLGATRLATAEPEDKTPEAVAERVLVAIKAKDAKTLQALARTDDPDPWRVALLLLRGGHPAEALVFAKATQGTATKGLAAATRSYPDAAKSQATQNALDTATRALGEGKPSACLRALEGLISEKAAGLLAVEVYDLRGQALQAQGLEDGPWALAPGARAAKLSASARAFARAASAAATLGWFTRASAAYYDAGSALWYLGGGDAIAAMMAEYFRKLTAIEARLGSKVGEARGRYRVAVAITGLGAYGEARALLRLAEDALEKGEDFEYLARARGHRAYILDLRGDTAAALALSCEAAQFNKQALARAEAKGTELSARFRSIPGELRAALAVRWVTCASWATKVGKLDVAEQYESKAAVAAAELEDPGLAARVAELRGLREQLTGHPLDALAAYAEAARAYQTTGELREAASVQGRASTAFADMGDLPRAISVGREALKVLRELRLDRDVASLLVDLAGSQVLVGLPAVAEAGLREALAVARRLGDPEIEGAALVEWARLAQAKGDVGGAMAALEAAIRVGRDHRLPRLRGSARNQLGALLVHAGAMGRARELFEAARGDFTETGTVSGLVDVRVSEGTAYLAAEQLERAREAFRLALQDTQSMSRHPNESLCREMLGKICLAQRRYPAAVTHARAVAKLAKRMNHAGKTTLAHASLGRALFYAGELKEAELELAAAVAAAKDYPDPEVRVVVAHRLADVRYQQGRWADAMKAAADALNEAKEYGYGLAEGEDAALRGALIREVCSVGRRAALKAGNPDAFYKFLEQARASTLVAALGGAEALRNAKVPAGLRKNEAEARAETARLKAEYRRATRRQERRAKKDLRKRLRKAQEKLRQAISAIRRKVRSQADLTYGDVLSGAEVQAMLGSKDIAILYVREVSEEAGGSLYALRVDKNDRTIHDLGPARLVDAAIQQLYDDPTRRVNASAASRLAKLLFKGIPRKGVERLWISPGEALATVPFGMLEKKRDIALMPSVTAMAMLKRLEKPGGTKVLALGDAVYGARGGTSLGSLLATKKEAEDVGDVVLLGENASETGFYKAVKGQTRWRAVHLACHGQGDMERGMRSTLILTPDEENDGNLDAREVFAMDIPADLVMLSACETGRGQVIRGDGLTGLMRAFMQAGAPRVICSLWRVPDEPTQKLMLEFYRLWNPKKPGAKRMSAAAALRAAQKYLREFKEDGKTPYSHPEYWAAWVLWGLPS